MSLTSNFSDVSAHASSPGQSADRLSLAILGAGAWGSALADLASSNHHSVNVWSRRGECSLRDAVSGVDVVVSAISMKGVSALAKQLSAIALPPRTIVVTATKGLDPDTTKTPSQIWRKALPNNPIVVLSGPNLSQEIEQGLPAATVLASRDIIAAQVVQSVFSSDQFRVYTSTDPLGAELGGTLKNIIAIAVGVCDGLNLGTNAKSALITRALPEIIRLGMALGADELQTFYGLSGLGDLLATCSSSLSRNYRVGYGLAQGTPLQTVLDNLGGTAEGVNTTRVLMQIVRGEGITAPIAMQVERLLDGEVTPLEALEALMERSLKPESV